MKRFAAVMEQKPEPAAACLQQPEIFDFNRKEILTLDSTSLANKTQNQDFKIGNGKGNKINKLGSLFVQ